MDIHNKASIEEAFKKAGTLDGIISACGSAPMGLFHEHTDADIDMAMNSKLKGQINLIRTGIHTVNENGFIIITTGAAGQLPMPGASSITMANCGLEGYVRAVNLEG